MRSMSPGWTGSASPGSKNPPLSVEKGNVTLRVGRRTDRIIPQTHDTRCAEARQASRPSIVSVGPLTASSATTRPAELPPKRQRQPRIIARRFVGEQRVIPAIRRFPRSARPDRRSCGTPYRLAAHRARWSSRRQSPGAGKSTVQKRGSKRWIVSVCCTVRRLASQNAIVGPSQ